jgi:hypothetical protein
VSISGPPRGAVLPLRKSCARPCVGTRRTTRKEAAFEDFGFGLGTTLELPGAGGILLYEARHPEAHSL